MGTPSLDDEWIRVPRRTVGDKALMEFALSYNPYEVYDDFNAVADISEFVREQFEKSGVLEVGLNELRTTLFFHQRAHRHAGNGDAFGDRAIVVALLDRIREVSGGGVRRAGHGIS